MKTMKKILSSVIAASLVLSCCMINVMAASKAHTVTLTADKTTDLKAGDKVTVEVKLDNTANILACGYRLQFDTSAFSIDTSKALPIKPAKYIDETWFNNFKSTDNYNWGAWLGTPVINQNTTEGVIYFDSAGTYGIYPDYAMDNYVIGKYYFTVNESVSDGTYQFSLVDDVACTYTKDDGQNSGTKITATPLSVKVGAEKVAPTPSKDDTNIGKQEQYTNADGTYNAGAKATVSADSTTKGVKGISFVFNNGTKDSAAYDVEFGTTITNGSASAALNITGVPADVTLTLKSATAIAE